jgi:hypothetical protein
MDKLLSVLTRRNHCNSFIPGLITKFMVHMAASIGIHPCLVMLAHAAMRRWFTVVVQEDGLNYVNRNACRYDPKADSMLILLCIGDIGRSAEYEYPEYR